MFCVGQSRGAERARVAGDELHETGKSVLLLPLVQLETSARVALPFRCGRDS
jgi:hypothetical protein